MENWLNQLGDTSSWNLKVYKEQLVRKVGKDINVGWLKEQWQGTSLAIQWLRLHTSTAGDQGSIPDWGTKILHATQCGQFFFLKAGRTQAY